MKKHHLQDSHSLIVAIQSEIRQSEETRYVHRLHAVLLVIQGMGCREVASLLGDSYRAVLYWVKRFKEQGLSGLQEGARSGRPARLNSEEFKTIAHALRKFPSDFGLEGLWDGKTLSTFIYQQWKIRLCVRQCQRIFTQLGFRLRKPRPKMAKADPEKQEAYKKTSMV